MDTARRRPGPIGIFDSGIGGLSIMRAVRALLPRADLVYVADSAHAPYGERTPEFIAERTLCVGAWLERLGSQALTLACNTATAVAVRELRASTRLPVVAIEPAIKPAVAITRSGVVGVLATTRTVRSASVERLCREHGSVARILLQACPGLAEQVEHADLDGPKTRALLRQYLEPLLEQGVDTLVLGCTHYPFLAPAIRALAGEGVTLIDPAQAVARELARRLEQSATPAAQARGSVLFFTSGDPEQVGPVIRRLWPEPVSIEALPAVESKTPR